MKNENKNENRYEEIHMKIKEKTILRLACGQRPAKKYVVLFLREKICCPGNHFTASFVGPARGLCRLLRKDAQAHEGGTSISKDGLEKRE